MRTAAPSLMMTLAITLVATSQAHAEIAWQTNLRTAHAQAQSEGKLLLLHFYSDNCTWCEKLEKGAFQEPQVGQAIHENYIPVKVHANSSPKLAEMFKVSKFPTDVIVTTDGKTLAHSVSPQTPDRYIAMLKTSASSAAGSSQPPATAVAAAAPQGGPAAANAALDAPQATPATPSADTYPVPGYATNDTPPMSANPANDQLAGGLGLPGSTLSSGTSAQLAGSRGPTLEMPSLGPANADAASAADSGSADELAADSVAASVSDIPAISQAPMNQAANPGIGSQIQPELAMQGFCPVTVIRQDKWVEGKPEYGVIHLGKLYLFTSEDNMQTFLKDPVPYTPVLNEIDAVIFFEERRIVAGKREWGLKDPIYNRMFFFADEASMNHFYNQYERYTKAAIEVMDKAVKDANPGT